MARTTLEEEHLRQKLSTKIAEAGLISWHLRHLVRNAFILGAAWVFDPGTRRRYLENRKNTKTFPERQNRRDGNS